MNQIIENIQSRRAVRQYDPKPVPKDVIQQIINAGNEAPSACNAQGWRFVVVTDEAFRKNLAARALSHYQKWIKRSSAQMQDIRRDIDKQMDDPVYYNAPVIIFVIGWGMSPDTDSPMVCQNMMLTARSLGVGSCWVFFGQLALDEAKVKEALELKKEEKVYGPILLGYPKGDFPPSPPKKPATIKWI